MNTSYLICTFIKTMKIKSNHSFSNLAKIKDLIYNDYVFGNQHYNKNLYKKNIADKFDKQGGVFRLFMNKILNIVINKEILSDK